jgi:hypothetical protein
LDLQVNFLDHAIGCGVVALNNADAFGGQVALFAEAQNVNACASPNGCEKNLKRHGG